MRTNEIHNSMFYRDERVKKKAKAQVENLIFKYGLFSTLNSDNSTEFRNEPLKEIYELLKIEQNFYTVSL